MRVPGHNRDALAGAKRRLVLVSYIPGGAITIAYGIREAVAAADRDGVRRRASRRQLRRLTRRKIASRYRTLTTEGAPGPSKASDVGADDGGGQCVVSDGAEATAMVKSCMTAF